MWFDLLPILRPTSLAVFYATVVHLQLAALKSAHEEGRNMKPVTTGPGISGIFTDDLVALIFDLRAESKDQRWRLYIEALRSHEYSLRVYAPDSHTEVHTVAKNLSTLETIRELLVKEGMSWQSRVLAALALTTD
jgi:hypothetical protein